MRDSSGNLIKTGVIMAFPTLQSGDVKVVLASATTAVKSTTFTVAMGDLITATP